MDHVPVDEQAIFLRSLLIRKWSASAALAVIVYEYIATLHDEIRFVWRKPFNVVRATYLFSRYFSLLVQSINLALVLGPFSTPGTTERVCRRWFAFQLASALVLLAALDLILMLRVYALYRKDFKIGIFLVINFVSLLAVEIVFGPISVYDVPYNSICTILEPSTGFVYFGIAVWVVHISIGALTAAKWKLTVMGVPIAKLVARDSAWALSLVCVLFAAMIPYVMSIQRIGPETAFMCPVSLFSIICCRIIINMQSLGHGISDEENSVELTEEIDIFSLDYLGGYSSRNYQ